MMRAQSALEFVLISTIMLLIFSAGFIIAEKRFAQVQESLYEKQIYALLDLVAAEIELAAQTGNGYTRNITLPQTFSGLPYSITITQNTTSSNADELLLILDNQNYLLFLDYDVSGAIDRGVNTLTGGNPVIITQP